MLDETSGMVEERGASLFQPDVLLPAQYFETLHRKAYPEPEKRLMLAVLEDAIVCFQRYTFARDSKRNGLYREAEKWILQVQENDEGVFSFENICEVLGFYPESIRQGLLRWKEKKMAERVVDKACRSSLRSEMVENRRS